MSHENSQVDVASAGAVTDTKWDAIAYFATAEQITSDFGELSDALLSWDSHTEMIGELLNLVCVFYRLCLAMNGGPYCCLHATVSNSASLWLCVGFAQ